MPFDPISFSIAKKKIPYTKLDTLDTPSDGEVLSYNAASGKLEWVPQSARVYTISLPHTNWVNGLSDEEIFRVQLNAGEKFKFIRGELQLKGGGTLDTLYIDIYDDTAASVLATITAGSVNTTEATTSDGATILFRVTNGSGSDQVACFYVVYELI